MPFSLKKMKFGSPNLSRVWAGLGRLPNEVSLTEGGEILRGVNRDGSVALGGAPKVAFVFFVAYNPRILTKSDWIYEVVFGKCSGLVVGWISAVGGHPGIPF